jgi:hypothetical protein
MEEEEKNESIESVEETNQSVEPSVVNSPIIAEARAENDRRERLLKEEKALQERKEKLHAEQMVGGHTTIGATEEPKEETAEEYADRIMRGNVK